MTPPDDAPQTGQRVWRYLTKHGFHAYFSRPDVGVSDEIIEGVWHSLDPKALDRTRLYDVMMEAGYARCDFPSDEFDGEAALAALLADLGLTPPEPKEGGRA